MLNCVVARPAAARALARVLSLGVTSLGLFALGLFPSARDAHAQADLLYRIERLENQIRQMTGDIEQLQYRNQQLESALNGMRDAGGAGRAAPSPAGVPPPVQPGAPGLSGGGRRGDAFDPSANPYAPGTPQALGATPPQPSPIASSRGRRGGDAFDPAQNPYAPGAPRTLGAAAPQPPPPNTRPGLGPTPYATTAGEPEQGYGQPSAAGGPPPGAGANPPPYAIATAGPPPSGGSPREVYDAGLVYLQRRDYAAAEQTFRDFLSRYPNDRMAGEAQFNLGESLYQRQDYHGAADAFVQLSKKYETSAKAPDALLRLGQSLAAMNENELACVAFGDVSRKYPRARSDVKQAVDRERKRARC